MGADFRIESDFEKLKSKERLEYLNKTEYLSYISEVMKGYGQDLKSPTAQVIPGTLNKILAAAGNVELLVGYHVYDPATTLDLFFGSNNEFVTGMELSEKQMRDLLENKNIM